MYRDFYRLSDEPFRVTPDPDFLFLAAQYKEALAAIVYGIAKRKGFVCITGEVGVGKTTILRSYLNSVEDQQLTFVYIFNPKVSFPVLMRTILRDLGQPTEGEVPDMVERLHEHLITCYKADKTVVLFVDEAQNMPQDTLENLRMLSNLETSTDKLLQIVLVGQPELDELLARPQLRQLRSRIVVRARLGPLSRKDSLAYIHHRLDRVALDDRPIFTDGAMDLIFKEAQGVPRIINILCDAALITGFGYRLRPVPARVVREVIRDNFGRDEHRRLPWAVGTAAAAVLIGAGVGVFWLHGQSTQPAVDAIGNLIAATERTASAEKDADPAPARPAEPAEPPKHNEESSYGPAEEGPDPAADLLRVVSPLPKPTPAAPAAAATAPAEPAAPAPAEAPLPAAPPAAIPLTPPPAVPPAAAAPPAPVANEPPKLVAALPPPLAQTQMRGNEPPADGRSVVVKAGDTLSKLSLDIYGKADTGIFGQLQRANPGMSNIDRLYIGQVIAFPSLSPDGTTADKRDDR